MCCSENETNPIIIYSLVVIPISAHSLDCDSNSWGRVCRKRVWLLREACTWGELEWTLIERESFQE